MVQDRLSNFLQAALNGWISPEYCQAMGKVSNLNHGGNYEYSCKTSEAVLGMKIEESAEIGNPENLSEIKLKACLRGPWCW